MKQLKDIEELESQIADYEAILKSRTRVYTIIIKELEGVIKKYGKPRQTKIINVEDVTEVADAPIEIPDYPVHLFFTNEGYFKKITPLSLRMSGEQKLKEGDEIKNIVETTNAKELLFFTNKFQVYKTRASEFDDTKASVLGDYIPAKLGFDEGEKVAAMIVAGDFSGYLLFFFENGKVAKTPLVSYQTKTKRKKLTNSYWKCVVLV